MINEFSSILNYIHPNIRHSIEKLHEEEQLNCMKIAQITTGTGLSRKN